MMEYKYSKYNFIFDKDENESIIYNSRSGAVAILDKTKAHLEIKELQKEENMEYLNLMNDNGFIVHQDEDETNKIIYEYLSARFSGASLNLTIAPTMNCNFRCVYCYEKHRLNNTVMSNDIQDQIVHLVKEMIKSIRELNITWYGGEPLLALEVIDNLSSEFKRMCSENDVVYRAGIITNGYLLTKQVYQHIITNAITSVQITLDGSSESHNQRRFLENGEPTYEKIIKNICDIKDIIEEPIKIRVNVDRNNINRVDDVISDLKEYGIDNVTYPYLAMVDNMDGTYVDRNCLSKIQYSESEYEFLERNKLLQRELLPNRIYNYCCADLTNSYVIDNYGNLYKCWKDIGLEERKIGTVADGIINEKLLFDYVLYRPEIDEKCRECKYLPICMGGCPYMRMHNKDNRCTKMKELLEKHVSMFANDCGKA